ncbi:hypothetical protein PR003_g1780 [Phytophthora rubi]|uniref:Uncharacterized protein n=1 Tax=Phytophthora rubi TaxID=129364 RepID=A0A6A4FUF7_9STRA|nr:hypothetical protein PR001_g1729 [Phytophthora rubi]KAE9357442.1 hypothetical protein PR003_g1780 [Phytophthora rubi]
MPIRMPALGLTPRTDLPARKTSTTNQIRSQLLVPLRMLTSLGPACFASTTVSKRLGSKDTCGTVRPGGDLHSGRAQARALIQREVDPWLADQISDVVMVNMLINVLFPILPTRPGWSFPRVDPVARRQYTPQDFCIDLITEDNVRALLDSKPWEVLEGTGTTISFKIDVGGRLGAAIQRYRSHEADSLQSYWESTHFFPHYSGDGDAASVGRRLQDGA